MVKYINVQSISERGIYGKLQNHIQNPEIFREEHGKR